MKNSLLSLPVNEFHKIDRHLAKLRARV